MSWIPTLVLALAVVALAGVVGFYLRRASRARRELAVSIHDKALGLDQRCDYLQAQIYALGERQRIDHLLDLVAHGEAEGRLDAEVARRLRRYALDLRAESLAPRA